MLEHAPDFRRTFVDVPDGWDVEIVREPCGCATGCVCGDDDPFAGVCPRRPAVIRWLVLGSTVDGPRYVRKLRPDPGDVEWTEVRTSAHRFLHRSEAAYVQGCIVAHNGSVVSVVPDRLDS